MSTTASNAGGGGDFEPVPEGTHKARCFQVIDLGTQPGSKMYPDHKHKVRIVWELPDEKIEIEGEQKPMTIGNEYTMSLHEKANLRRDLESWRGKVFTDDELGGFDIAKLLGVPCLMTVVHKQSGDKTYANIKGVMGMPEIYRGDMQPQFNKSVHYQLEDGENEVFKSLRRRRT